MYLLHWLPNPIGHLCNPLWYCTVNVTPLLCMLEPPAGGPASLPSSRRYSRHHVSSPSPSLLEPFKAVMATHRCLLISLSRACLLLLLPWMVQMAEGTLIWCTVEPAELATLLRLPEMDPACITAGKVTVGFGRKFRAESRRGLGVEDFSGSSACWVPSPFFPAWHSPWGSSDIGQANISHTFQEKHWQPGSWWRGK